MQALAFFQCLMMKSGAPGKRKIQHSSTRVHGTKVGGDAENKLGMLQTKQPTQKALAALSVEMSQRFQLRFSTEIAFVRQHTAEPHLRMERKTAEKMDFSSARFDRFPLELRQA